ncbi:MAG: hypothetical protein ACHBNF_04925 [Chromatiales bacterium]
MEITSFDVSPDQYVTLAMNDMPTGVRTENTLIYIAGIPLGKPDEVSVTNQEIKFSAASSGNSGKISVRATLENGKKLVATSPTDYTLKSPEDAPHPPRVRSVSPSATGQGSRATLRGENLADVQGVSLNDGYTNWYTCRAVQAAEDGTSVGFTIPQLQGTIEPGQEREYAIGIKLSSSPVIVRTNVKLKVTS